MSAAGLLRRDAQLLDEAIRRQPVGEAVGHGLDLARASPASTSSGATSKTREATVVCRSSPERESLDQRLVAGQVGHDPHLDLAVVGREQRLVAGADDERLADTAPLVGADRDVLQVGIGRGQPPGRGDGLVERGVDAAVVGDRLQQAFDGRRAAWTRRGGAAGARAAGARSARRGSAAPRRRWCSRS